MKILNNCKTITFNGDSMSVWERLFDVETLIKAKNNVKIKNVQRKRNEIIAETDNPNYKLNATVKYNSPYNITCTCEKKDCCEHEAALRYYIDEHPSLLKKTEDVVKIANKLKKKELKEFLLKEIEQNTLLANNFLKEFDDKQSIDKEQYSSKLTSILRLGEGPDFYLHHIYDFDRLENKLFKFLKKDLNDILNAEEYGFACELLCKIADVLNDELSINQESWYNLTEKYSEYAFALIQSLYLSKEEINELEMKTYRISKYL